MVIVPNVAINGGSLKPATKYPFTTPTAKLAINVINVAIQGFIPLVIIVALIIVDIPTIEPIERSIFPVMSTNDCPIPIRTIGAICLNKLLKFLDEKNSGFMIPNAIQSTIRPIKTVTTCLIPGFANCFFIILLFAIFYLNFVIQICFQSE